MDRQIITTADGSSSIAVPALQVTYHSVHGAVQESQHVFIKAGLQYFSELHPDVSPITIFEMGFGTGLNALLTLIAQDTLQRSVYYESVELSPLEPALFSKLNYCTQLNRQDLEAAFSQMLGTAWNEPVVINPGFTLHKKHGDLIGYQPKQKFHLVYFDAFAPTTQPELWTTDVFHMLHALLVPGGVLTTYCSKSSVRRAMTEAGFNVEKIPGPPRKREMVRATRSS